MKNWYSESFKVGVLGGGQLGRMLIQEAVNYDIKLHIMDKDSQAPCARIAHTFVNEDILDYDAVMRFGADKDVITVEIENVCIEALEELERQGKKVFPQPAVLRTVKDKGVQKEFYQTHHLPTAPFYLVSNKEEVLNYVDQFPFFQKLRVGGYDGKGVQALRTEADLDNAFDAPCVLEKFVDFEKEISVIVARNENGEVSHFPVVECEFNPEANLVEFLFAPAQISEAIEEEAIAIATKTIEALNMVGLLAVELFVTKDGRVLINEIAPRPHNSGHHTIECNVSSQYEQHLRAILNMPLGSTKILRPGVMINLLGEKGYDGAVKYEGLDEALKIPGVKIHLYGKAQTKPFRKMGHVTATAPLLQEAKDKARQVQQLIRVIAE
jgi:5-(carboxyamino)imidazole ribonucleotide synthase